MPNVGVEAALEVAIRSTNNLTVGCIDGTRRHAVGIERDGIALLEVVGNLDVAGFATRMSCSSDGLFANLVNTYLIIIVDGIDGLTYEPTIGYVAVGVTSKLGNLIVVAVEIEAK